MQLEPYRANFHLVITSTVAQGIQQLLTVAGNPLFLQRSDDKQIEDKETRDSFILSSKVFTASNLHLLLLTHLDAQFPSHICLSLLFIITLSFHNTSFSLHTRKTLNLGHSRKHWFCFFYSIFRTLPTNILMLAQLLEKLSYHCITGAVNTIPVEASDCLVMQEVTESLSHSKQKRVEIN